MAKTPKRLSLNQEFTKKRFLKLVGLRNRFLYEAYFYDVIRYENEVTYMNTEFTPSVRSFLTETYLPWFSNFDYVYQIMYGDRSVSHLKDQQIDRVRSIIKDSILNTREAVYELSRGVPEEKVWNSLQYELLSNILAGIAYDDILFAVYDSTSHSVFVEIDGIWYDLHGFDINLFTPLEGIKVKYRRGTYAKNCVKLIIDYTTHLDFYYFTLDNMLLVTCEGKSYPVKIVPESDVPRLRRMVMFS